MPKKISKYKSTQWSKTHPPPPLVSHRRNSTAQHQVTGWDNLAVARPQQQPDVKGYRCRGATRKAQLQVQAGWSRTPWRAEGVVRYAQV